LAPDTPAATTDAALPAPATPLDEQRRRMTEARAQARRHRRTPLAAALAARDAS
jgi:hypothetical protein